MYHVITIERQFASGGNEIGKRLAKELGYKLYDWNLLMEAAGNLEIPAIYIENLEETSSGSLIFNLAKTALVGGDKEESKLPLAERLFLEEKRIVERVAQEGDCIIVGRAAGYILRERSDCLRVYVGADREARAKRAIESEGVNPEEVEAVLKKNDKRRSNFFNTNTQWKWGEPEYFEICLNSSKLGLDLCVELLMAAAGQF